MRKTLLSCVLALIMIGAWGCSGGSGALSGPPGVAQTSATRLLLGTVSPGLRLAGLQVEVHDLQGNPLVQTVTDQSGDFRVKANLPADVRVVARVPGSDQLLSAEVRGLGERRYVVINIPTTLASELLRLRGGTLAEAEALVRKGLAIPAGLDLGFGLDESPTSAFSHLAFLVEAAVHGGVKNYLQNRLESLDTDPTAFLLTPGTLTAPVDGLEPGLKELAQRLQAVLPEQVRFSSPRRPATGPVSLLRLPYSTPNSFGYGVWQGITGNLITGIPGALTSGLGLLFNSLGLNFTTSGKLQQIQTSLNGIQGQLDELQTQLAQDSLEQTVADLDAATTPVTTQFQNYVNGASNSTVPATVNVPIGVNGGPLTLPGAACGLSIPDLSADIAQMSNFLGTGLNPQGQPNAIAKSAALLAPRYGLDQKSKTFNLPVRSNKLIAQAQNQMAIYHNVQLQGLTLLAENCHTYSAQIPDPVNFTYLTGNSCINQQQQLYVNLKKQAQQVPIELPRSDIIVDLEFGLMWYNVLLAPRSWADAQDYATNFQIQGLGADASTVTYNDWRLPTAAECKALQLRGRYNPHASTSKPVLPFNSNNGFPDTGFTTNGLADLGFVMGSNSGYPWASSDEAKNGEIWFNYWVFSHDVWTIGYPVLEGGLWQQQVPPQTWNMFRLNHESNNIYEVNSGTRPFFLVRSILGEPTTNSANDLKPVLAWDGDAKLTDGVDSHDHGQDTPFAGPSDYNSLGPGLPNTVQPGEYPSLGIVTALTPPTAVTAPANPAIPAGTLQLATGLTFQVSLGGSATLGKPNESGKNTSLSLNSRVFTNPSPIQTVDRNNLPNPLADLVAFFSTASTVNILNVPGPLPTQTQIAARDFTQAIGLQGMLIPFTTAPVTVTAQLLAPGSDTNTFTNVTSSATITPPAAADHTLSTLQILPRNLALGGGSTTAPFNQLATVGAAAQGLPLSLTAFYADGTADILGTSATNRPANNSVVWTITPEAARTQLNASISVIGNTVTLNYDGTGLPSATTVTFEVNASFGGQTDSATFSVSKP